MEAPLSYYGAPSLKQAFCGGGSTDPGRIYNEMSIDPEVRCLRKGVHKTVLSYMSLNNKYILVTICYIHF